MLCLNRDLFLDTQINIYLSKFLKPRAELDNISVAVSYCNC